MSYSSPSSQSSGTTYFSQLSRNPETSGSAFIELDIDLDCPAIHCDGWLIVYCQENDTKRRPHHVCCSKKKDQFVPCTTPTIFSKKSSVCMGCKEEIKLVILMITFIGFIFNIYLPASTDIDES